MATEYQPSGSTEEGEEVSPKQVSYDSILGANCMLWLMIIGLSFIALVIVVWAISNFHNV